MKLRGLWAVLGGTALVLVLALGVVVGVNANDKGWDGRAHYLADDDAIVGRPGALVVMLAQPSRYDPGFYVHFVEKLFGPGGAIPWPISALAGADAGVALIDPARPYAPEPFAPTALVDASGSTRDVDGVAYLEKWKSGKVRWVKPSKTVAHDTGFFLYEGRKGGMRTPAAKLLLKARHLYYAQLPDGYLPHGDHTRAMVAAALAQLDIAAPGTPAAAVDAFDPAQMRAAVRQVLDAGVDTIVLASAIPILSDFEELRGSYPKVKKEIDLWRGENGGKPIKIVIADGLSTSAAYYEGWAATLDRVLAPAPRPSAPATIVITYHGLPATMMKTDYWSTLRAPVDARMREALAPIAQAKGYAPTFVTAFEGFAEGVEDPDDKILGVGETLRAAQAKGDGLTVALPIEFLAENTDTLYAHAVSMFDGLPGYALYEGPPPNVDWSAGHVRRFQAGGATAIYAGAPSLAEQARFADALADVLIAAVRPDAAAIHQSTDQSGAARAAAQKDRT